MTWFQEISLVFSSVFHLEKTTVCVWAAKCCFSNTRQNKSFSSTSAFAPLQRKSQSEINLFKGWFCFINYITLQPESLCFLQEAAWLDRILTKKWWHLYVVFYTAFSRAVQGSRALDWGFWSAFNRWQILKRYFLGSPGLWVSVETVTRLLSSPTHLQLFWDMYLQSSFLFLFMKILLDRFLGIQSYHKGEVRCAQRLPVNMSITNDVKVETLLPEFICELLTYRTPLGRFLVCLFYFRVCCLFVCLLILILSEVSKSTVHSTWYCAEHVDCSLCGHGS